MVSFADIVRRIGTACEATDALCSFCGETVRLCVSSSHHSDAFRQLPRGVSSAMIEAIQSNDSEHSRDR